MKLFWKVLFTLLLTLLLTVALSAWLSRAWMQEHSPVEQQMQALADMGETARTVYQQEGKRGYQRWLRKLMRQRHIRGFLLNAQGKPLLHRPLLPPLRHLAEQVRSQQKMVSQVRLPMIAVATPLPTQPLLYWLAMTRIPAETLHYERNTLLVFRISMIVVALLLISVLLTRMFTRPIRALERQSEQLTQGQWDVPVAKNLCQRRDEWGDLARSFEAMRAALQTLMQQHQQLLRDVSHELRSPLARLQVALELARNAPQDALDAELNRIEKEAVQLNALIAEVLTLAYVEQHEQKPKQRLDLAVVIREVVQDAAFEAESLGKTVHFHSEDEVCLKADALWLRRALDNVMRNAVRHAQHQVLVRLVCSPTHAQIYIRDDGSGVAEEALQHLFQPFFRAEDGHEGYGLGLAIARCAMEHEGGTIAAQNHAEGGLEVRMQLNIE